MEGSNGSLGRALAGLCLAAPLWTFVFRSGKGNFWARMTGGAGSLGLFALIARPDLRRDLPAKRDLAPGVASAAVLYLVFHIGDRLARRVMPAGADDIAEIYRLRTLAPRPLIALLLSTVIGPSEELFWRGLIQRSFMDRWGKWRGSAAAAAAYGGVHLVTGNLTLTGAAGTAGAYWGILYALRPRLGTVMVSHVAWDLWIFLIQPTEGGRAAK